MNETTYSLAVSIILFIIGVLALSSTLGYDGITLPVNKPLNAEFVKTIYSINRENIVIPGEEASTGCQTLRITSVNITGNLSVGWNITFNVRNTGYKQLRIDEILVNNKSQTNCSCVKVFPEINGGFLTVPPGMTQTIIVKITPTDEFTSGENVEVTFRVVDENKYNIRVSLP